jgi:cardiolipin synthase
MPPLRQLAAQAFSRAAGAPLIPGNQARFLRDAAQNYPAWMDAIRGASRNICFENYIFTDDPLCRSFVEALAERASAGVKVRVLYDWLGTSTWRMRHLWRTLRAAGAEVRCFNRPRWDEPFSWLSRDHRKTLSVDGRIGFVSGLCVSARWLGKPDKQIGPWRDTGLEIVGPAVLELESAFARVWEVAGGSFPFEDRTSPEIVPADGSVSLRVVAGAPSTAGLYRLDQLIAALARETLWLTDAYFVGVSSYVQALCAAARDGVDVRLLVPGASDIWWISPLSRAGYRPLLEAGVRIFEWNGSMLHAKTAVADNRWARVGSTNLNLSSWLANWELDVAVEDGAVASSFSYAFEQDLAYATEIILAGRRRARARARTHSERRPRQQGTRARRAAVGALRVGSALGEAIMSRRVLGPAEATLLLSGGLLMGALALAGFFYPRVLAWPLALFSAWIGSSTLLRGLTLMRAGRRRPRAGHGPHPLPPLSHRASPEAEPAPPVEEAATSPSSEGQPLGAPPAGSAGGPPAPRG